MEGLEAANALAKQVLSQLSYTPTVGLTIILNHFSQFQNPFPIIPCQWNEPLSSCGRVKNERVKREPVDFF